LPFAIRYWRFSKETSMKGTKRAAIALMSLIILLLPAWSTVLAAAGTGPDDALVLPAGWVQLNAKESRWYAFTYTGDSSQIQVRLQAEPAGSAAFAVWTPEDARNWRLGLEVHPVGRGSADPSAGGALVWSGSFTIGGTYYVVVEHSGSQPGASYYLLQVGGQGVSLVTATPTATPRPAPAQSSSRPAVASAPTGKLVFQTTWGGPFYTINTDGTGLRRITDGVDPAWSPNGQQIAFTRFRDPRGVWVVNADGSNERRVFDWSETRWPSWSPDGTRILFSEQKGGRTDSTTRCFFGFCFTLQPHPKWRLGTVRLADGYFAEPASSMYTLAPAWSPAVAGSDAGSSRFVYADEQGLRVQSEDGQVSYLITDDSRDTSPVWSPDGQRVAFTRRQHDHWEVYVVDADGRNLRRLTDTPLQPDGDLGNSASPAWSPNGQYLAFFTDRSGKWEIWIMRADGNQQRPMFKGAVAGLTLDYASLGERAISWTR
jgi:Tol biopolymer transport system component